MGLIQEFKTFALRGNLVDLAIGFTVGAAFSTVAKSLVEDVIMPPVGLALGQSDFADMFWILKPGSEAAPLYATLAEAQAAGAVTLNHGVFVNNCLALLLVAVAMFAVIRAYRRIEDELEEHLAPEERAQPEEPDEKKCPFCRRSIPYRASRCPECTSRLEEEGKEEQGAPVVP